MAKRLMYLAVSALALTACTSTDVIDDVATSNNNVIRFENVVKKHTRATTDLTSKTFNHFNVFGFYTVSKDDLFVNQVFDNVEIQNDGNGKWDYVKASDTRYWVPGGIYYFYAYSCGSASLGKDKFGEFALNMKNPTEEDATPIAPSERVLEIDEYLCDYTHQHDLVVASSGGIEAREAGTGDVSLTFNHILSKVKAAFASKFPAEYELTITDVKINNICNVADYNFKEGWKNREREGDLTLVYLLNTKGDESEADKEIKVKNELVGPDDAKTQSTVETASAYVIPYDYDTDEIKTVTLSFVVKVSLDGHVVINNTTLTAEFAPVWEQGKAYVYNIEIRPEDLKLGKISFTTSIGSWEDAEDLDDEKYDLTIDK